jgi:hypothetical protein
METIKYGETKRYGLFRYIDNNRKIRIDNKFDLLCEQISLTNGNTVPIIVNSDYLVIDGQHRLEACKKLNLPVAYRMVDGDTEQLMVTLNRTQRPWNTEDYINKYVQQGNVNYIALEHELANYGNISKSLVYEFFSKTGHRIHKQIKEGTYMFDSRGHVYFASLIALHEVLGRDVYRTQFARAIKNVLNRNSHFSIEEFVRKCQSNKIYFYDKQADNEEQIIKVYNKRRQINKIS